jgi:predicted acyltransferase
MLPFDYGSILYSIDSDLIALVSLYKVGDEIVRKSLCYPFKLIAKNAGVDGRVVTEMVVFKLCMLLISGCATCA